MKKFVKKQFARVWNSARNQAMVSGAVALSLVGLNANATIDVTSVTSAVTDASTAGVTVAAAVLAMIATIRAFKYIRAAM